MLFLFVSLENFYVSSFLRIERRNDKGIIEFFLPRAMIHLYT